MKKLGGLFIILGLLGLPFLIYLAVYVQFKGQEHIGGIIGIFLLGLIFNGIALRVIERPKAARQKTKRILLGLGILGSVIVAIGSTIRLRGGGIILILSSVILLAGYGPLIVKDRYQKWKTYTQSNVYALSLSTFDLLTISLLFFGFIAKRFHWPAGEEIIIIGLTLIPIDVILWNRLFKKVVIKQKETEEKLQDAFEAISEKNDEILDSISYAKRIQEAILPPLSLINDYLENSFILYKPKDIVAGDFYWFEAKGGVVYFAVADCTGHGVPGAMVSVVCSNALNRSINELNIQEPALILDKVKELVIETFEKSEEEIKDGMDISFCKLNLKTNMLTYAGAHNPLYRITALEGEMDEKAIYNKTHMLVEYKGDKQPIGKWATTKNFTQIEIQLIKGDSIYISSDGYADQFGGEKGKKFMYKSMKRLLLDIQSEDVNKQKVLLNETFENWKGSQDQVDDVCIMGVRV